MNPAQLRLLDDAPLPGPINMARDEALLHAVERGEAGPTLRLYRWDPPTISLGYFQCYADYEALPEPAGSLPVVRRLTGGGAILHDLELTYSLTLPLDHPALREGPNRLYELAHDAVIAVLGELTLPAHREGSTDDSGPRRGPFFCFARRHRLDVLVGTDKIAGSAQRRTRKAVLQHGSIILANRYTQQPTAEAGQQFEQALQQVKSTLPGYVAEAMRLTLTPGSPVGQVEDLPLPSAPDSGGRSLTCPTTGFKSDSWSKKELAEAETLTAKYAGKEWTRRC